MAATQEASASLKFDSTGKTFNQEFYTETLYEADGWMGRKVMALPKALWSATVMVIYDLVNMIIGGLNGFINGDCGNQMMASGYSVIRDLQKACGHLLQIFSDKCGSYHVTKAEYNRAAYASQIGALAGLKAVGGEEGMRKIVSHSISVSMAKAFAA